MYKRSVTYGGNLLTVRTVAVGASCSNARSCCDSDFFGLRRHDDDPVRLMTTFLLLPQGEDYSDKYDIIFPPLDDC